MRTRRKTLIWLLRQNKLLTYQQLGRRGVIASTYCPVCGRAEETALHAMRDCEWARQTWATLIQPSSRNTFFAKTLVDWVDWNRKSILCRYEWEVPWNVIFTETINLLWQERNRVTHDEDKDLRPHISLQQIRSRSEESTKMTTWNPEKSMEELRVKWVRPSRGRLKLNVDGSVRRMALQEIGPAAIGGVFRDLEVGL